MIPKIIHYCWFGQGKKPELALKCIESWKKYLADYELVEWNESNFNISQNQYVQQAYENKKYAFVTDYVRLYVMYHYGGIYMDTDVEVIGNLDEFLHHQAFSGFESKGIIPTGIMASEKEYSLFKEFMDYYEDKPFIKEDGSLDMKPNTVIMTDIISKYGFVPDGTYQIVKGFAIYPEDVFCPLEMGTGILKVTDRTKTIHYFSASWYSQNMKIKSKIAKYIRRIIGVRNAERIVNLFHIKTNT